MDTLKKENTTTEPIKKPKGHFRRNWSFYLLLLSSLGLTAYTWFTKEYALTYQKETFEDQQLALIKTANNTLKSTTENDLKLVAKSLAYAVANRVIFDDWEEVDKYFQQLVKAENMVEIFLLQDDGMIMVATNKKMEGEFYKDSNLTSLQETTTILLLKDDAGRNLVVAPVMMKENRQGTVAIVYQPVETNWQNQLVEN